MERINSIGSYSLNKMAVLVQESLYTTNLYIFYKYYSAKSATGQPLNKGMVNEKLKNSQAHTLSTIIRSCLYTLSATKNDEIMVKEIMARQQCVK